MDRMLTKNEISVFHAILSKGIFFWLAAIFLLASLLRSGPIIYKELRSPGWHANNINEIEFYYDDVARSLLAGKGFVHSVSPRSSNQPFSFEPGTPFHFVPPLYAWWVYLIYLIFGPNIVIAKIIQCFLDSSVCLLLYIIGMRIFTNEKQALLGAILYAVYPLAIIMCSTLFYQIPLNVVLCLVILGYMAPTNWKNGFWTGIAMGVSALAKPVTLPFLVLLPILRLVEFKYQRVTLKPAMIWGLFFTIAGVAVLAPWTIRNYMVFNKFVPVQHGGEEVLLQGSREEYIDLDVNSLRERYPGGLAPEHQGSKMALSNHFEHFVDNPLSYLRFLAKKFALSWYNTEGKQKNFLVLLVQVPFLLLSLISLVFSFKIWIRRPNWYIPAVILYFCAIQVFLFPLVRYTLAVMPLVLLLAADGLMTVGKKVCSKKI